MIILLKLEDKLILQKSFLSLKKKIFAICWGLQLIVTASGGEVKKSNTGTQVGIAIDIELTPDGLNHPVYKSKLKKFTTPAFNFDEVVKLPDNSVHLAFNKTNKIQGLAFKSGNCDIWGLQYHPEIHYDYMIRLINDRREKLIKKKCFKNDEEINHHIQFIKKERDLLDDDFRLLEIKNWLQNLNGN